MKKTAWRAFPYPDEAFDYTGAALKKHWDRLHRGDQEPFPSAQYLARLGKSNRALVDSIPRFDGDYAALSERVLETWRLYHRGEFAAAAESGLSLGVPGYAAANKATAMYAHYLEQSKPAKLKLFQEIAARADEARGIVPDDVNSHYLYANALGRYSQGISVVEALSQGLGGRVKAALERTLALQPEHAEAHAAMGTYHAEVVGKVGGMLAGLTYGEGELNTKNAGSHPVFWQGPSLGLDWGGQGSRTMMLVYNLPEVNSLYDRFAGVSGSAYVVAGVGMTVLTEQNVVLVPIRTGVGARLGINAGYLKLTRNPTWNPF